MKYKRPLIIGAGSIGSILCEKISLDNYFLKMTILDYDLVTERNLNNSIFKSEDVGKKKIDVIYNKFKHNINIDKFDLKFDEEICNDLFDCDLIIDCRDFLYDRKNIDVRLFVYDKFLIIDCRKFINYSSSYEGTYFWNISKDELCLLADKFINMIKTNQIDNIIKNKDIIKLDLNKFNYPVISSHHPDLVVDNNNKISNVDEIGKLNLNNKNINVEFCFFDGKIKHHKINTERLTTSELINELNFMIPKYDNNNYVIITEKEDKLCVIPETGAA